MAPKASMSREFILPDQRKRDHVEEKWANVMGFVWNPYNQEFMGRDPLSWVMIMGFYLVFWACLAALFGVLLALFLYTIVDANYPMRDGMDSMQKGNPGLSFRPMADLDTTLIRFVQGVPSTYKFHTDHIQAFLDQYENEKQTGENFIDCSNGKSEQDDAKVCRFDVDTLGDECTWQQDYGFDEGVPCILLKMNKMFAWTPEPYDGDVMPTDPLVQKTTFRKGHIGISCEGETPSDQEHMGNITFYPPYGFPDYYFPYINQEGYRQPVVMAQFMHPSNGLVINVWCKAWAYNIRHHRYDRAGSTHFELLVD